MVNLSDIFKKVSDKIEKKYNPAVSNKTEKFKKRVRFAKYHKPGIKVLDPIGLQVIKSVGSPPSKGHYKKFKLKSILKKPVNLRSSLLRKPCGPGKVRNQKTGRCINQKKNVLPKKIKKDSLTLPKLRLIDKKIIKQLSDIKAGRRKVVKFQGAKMLIFNDVKKSSPKHFKVISRK